MSGSATVEQTVMFADLAGFTALTEAHGDVDAADIAVRFAELATHALVDDARIIKTIGDAVMVVTDDPGAGVGTSRALLRAVEQEPRFPGVRIGLHAGPVIEREGDVFGATVNLAARLAADAAIGQVLTTKAVADQVSNTSDVVFEALGERRLRNVRNPVGVFAILDANHEPTGLVHDPVCQMLVDPNDAPARLPYLGRSWWFCSLDCARTFATDPQRYLETLMS